jgi:phosphatidylserine/phosphatidylglycerophosphate/cardiolipin synthase-like enzyme
MNSKLFAQIQRIAALLPPTVLDSLTQLLVAQSVFYSEAIKHQILNQFPNPKLRRMVAELLATWQADGNSWDSRAIAAALHSSAYTLAIAREALSVEVVWTGPETERIVLRRTDRVLLQLIEQAQQELIIISFAVYDIPTIARAMQSAIQRGVNLLLVVETPASGDGKIPFGIDTALGKEIIEQARVFVWPKEKRPVDNEGRYGSLHVKCAISDRDRLFLTSANLTKYALTLNMEMGLLVHSQDLATQIAKHVETLVEQNILVLLAQ